MKFMLTLTVPMEFQERLHTDPELPAKLEAMYKASFALNPEALYASGSRRRLVLVYDLERILDLQPLLQQIWDVYRVYPEVDPVLDKAEFIAMKNSARGIHLSEG